MAKLLKPIAARRRAIAGESVPEQMFDVYPIAAVQAALKEEDE